MKTLLFFGRIHFSSSHQLTKEDTNKTKISVENVHRNFIALFMCRPNLIANFRETNSVAIFCITVIRLFIEIKNNISAQINFQCEIHEITVYCPFHMFLSSLEGIANAKIDDRMWKIIYGMKFVLFFTKSDCNFPTDIFIWIEAIDRFPMMWHWTDYNDIVVVIIIIIEHNMGVIIDVSQSKECYNESAHAFDAIKACANMLCLATEYFSLVVDERKKKYEWKWRKKKKRKWKKKRRKYSI